MLLPWLALEIEGTPVRGETAAGAAAAGWAAGLAADDVGAWGAKRECSGKREEIDVCMPAAGEPPPLLLAVGWWW